MLIKEREITSEEIQLLFKELGKEDQRFFKMYFIDKLSIENISKHTEQGKRMIQNRIIRIKYRVKKYMNDAQYVKAIEILYK